MSFLDSHIREEPPSDFYSSRDPTEEVIGVGIFIEPRSENIEELIRSLLRFAVGKISNKRSMKRAFCAVEVAISRRSRSLGLPSTALKTLAF